jgi:uncharacterized protein (DUF433 family)
MNTLQQFEKFLSGLKRAEKARLLQWVAQDLGDSFPGIESTPNVCDGEPCIVRTRIPVWVLVQARNLGMSEAAILESYPTLPLAEAAMPPSCWQPCVTGLAGTP